MRAGGDLSRDVVIRINGQRLRTLHGVRLRMTVRQHKARHAIGQRRRADALRAADQPGMRDSPAAIGGKQRRLCLAMPEQFGGLAQMWGGDLFLGLAGVHTDEAVLAIANRWSRKAVQTCTATTSGPGVASIRTQRLGSSAAICR